MIFFVRYVCALFYDALILITLFFAFTIICLFFRHGQVITSDVLWYQISLLAIIYAYYLLSYRNGGQTIGLQAWKLKLISNRTPITPAQVILRPLVFLPAFILSGFSPRKTSKLIKAWTGTSFIHYNP